jgi:hypothetical protein
MEEFKPALQHTINSILASAKVASLDTPYSFAVCMLIYFLLMCLSKLSQIPRVGVLELFA